MGRFSMDGDAVYFTTDDAVRRLRYDAAPSGGDGWCPLSVDPTWGGSYRVPLPQEAEADAVDAAEVAEAEAMYQSAGWDTCLGSGCIWMMDMGRPLYWPPGMANAPQRAFRFSLDDATDRDVIDAIGEAPAWNPGPPLYDPERRILVHYDTLGGVVVAHRYEGPGDLPQLWRREYRNSVQMMLYPHTGELVLEDSPNVMGDATDGAVVVVDIETGAEKGRAPLRERGTMGMFLCPGFGRDFYVCSIAGTIARVYVEQDGADAANAPARL